MAIKMFDDGEWLVQLQRGSLRKTRRGEGGTPEARKAEKELSRELDRELARAAKEAQAMPPTSLLAREQRATILPVRRARSNSNSSPTLRDFFVERWLDHSKVVQNALTREKSRVPFNYLLHYLAGRTLDELLQPKLVNAFIEDMKTHGPLAFTLRRDGEPIKRRKSELTNSSINKCLQCLKAILNLAHAEGIVDRRPRIDLLPLDNSVPVVACSETEFQRLLASCEHFREIAPHLPEVVVFAAETGMRRAELFMLTWGSVDFARKAVRVEMQQRGRLINGQAWRPKHAKWREIPMSERVEEILRRFHEIVPHAPTNLVIPSRGGSPYCRMDNYDGAEGKGYFADAVEHAGLRGKLSFHGLRHYFAVQLLTRGAPITVVSELLGHSDINLTVKRYGRFASDAKIKWDVVRGRAA